LMVLGLSSVLVFQATRPHGASNNAVARDPAVPVLHVAAAAPQPKVDPSQPALSDSGGQDVARVGVARAGDADGSPETASRRSSGLASRKPIPNAPQLRAGQAGTSAAVNKPRAVSKDEPDETEPAKPADSWKFDAGF